MESKDIQNIIINDVNYDKDSSLYKYINMIQTPFNDLGLLYRCPVKLGWLLYENNIDINEFKNFELKYLNMYFDEECLDLFEHKILINKDNFYDNIKNSDILNENILISERMKYIINKKNHL